MIFLFLFNLFSHYLNLCKLLAPTPSNGNKLYRLGACLGACCIRKHFLIFPSKLLIHYIAPLTKPVLSHWSDCRPFPACQISEAGIPWPKTHKLQVNTELLLHAWALDASSYYRHFWWGLAHLFSDDNLPTDVPETHRIGLSVLTWSECVCNIKHKEKWCCLCDSQLLAALTVNIYINISTLLLCVYL